MSIVGNLSVHCPDIRSHAIRQNRTRILGHLHAMESTVSSSPLLMGLDQGSALRVDRMKADILLTGLKDALACGLALHCCMVEGKTGPGCSHVQWVLQGTAVKGTFRSSMSP